MITQNEANKIIEFSNKNGVSIEIVTKEFAILKVLDMFNKIFKTNYFVLKGGTSLSLFYGSGRFSEDIDLDMLYDENFDQNTQTERAKLFLKKLDSKSKGIFQFDVKDKLSRGSFYFKGDYGIPDVRIKFDIRLKAFTDGQLMSTVKEKSDLLLEMGFPLEFKCISSKLILSNKLICIGGREKGRDLYDFYFLIKEGYKIDIDYIFNYLKEYNEINNDFFGLRTKEDIKNKLKERIEYLENSHGEKIFEDINEFLIDSRKIDKSTFFIEIYEEIDNYFNKHFVLEGGFDSSEDLNLEFQDLDFFEEEDFKRKKIIDFLYNWSKRNKNSGTKKFKNGFFLIIESGFYRFYRDGILISQFKNKDEVIQYLYDNHEQFF